MKTEDAEQARQRAIARLQIMSSETAARARDRFWHNGTFNVQRWVERAFNSAIEALRQENPASGEDVSSYLVRVAVKVNSMHDNGPDADDEAWYAGAIDEACSVITCANCVDYQHPINES